MKLVRWMMAAAVAAGVAFFVSSCGDSKSDAQKEFEKAKKELKADMKKAEKEFNAEMEKAKKDLNK